MSNKEEAIHFFYHYPDDFDPYNDSIEVYAFMEYAEDYRLGKVGERKLTPTEIERIVSNDE